MKEPDWTKKELTFGDILHPAMTTKKQAEADAYFEKMVQYNMRFWGKSREESEQTPRSRTSATSPATTTARPASASSGCSSARTRSSGRSRSRVRRPLTRRSRLANAWRAVDGLDPDRQPRSRLVRGRMESARTP